MSARQRGQEVFVRFTVDGVIMGGSWSKMTDWSLKPRTDLVEDDFLGEIESDIDIQHHGYDVSFSAQNKDEKLLEFLMDITDREAARLRHPRIIMTVMHFYREAGAKDKTQSFSDLVLKVDEHAFGGRKDRTKTTFSGKCKTMSLAAA